ncbi:hypothetical protein A7K93_04420 [Candidatus Methylacidiphilum fumarolicum]|uniref:Uncharacterized protein n=2 Tax=Candidatus Methylacidiphilum fumarolicum TaxID=591154 RepID=I0JZ66_METFB|nr:hypothetical protein [Candidatus Methylacidiphilum fumarolicum]MBW6414690.1 hypothetical protein [Candidatus Methylacidiphilum fumarolicum]TFE70171.1 hypothetical protein A7K73_04655 [Candidatus Methylacidiphilum fumarolicum]TFE74262.1 hypothetical protein A7K93_04420 [Candidatus Methylacidiphilum fumarolicum]TFE75761.1 hypothetical protein A7K72_01100 [Candidatus Methylacidiphilum fumarolicum]TFE75920.1 hypothetical protein A7D33_01305 [Candidatus Methylacidiphilum fumarolicum]
MYGKPIFAREKKDYVKDKFNKVVARRLIGLGLACIGLVVGAMMMGGKGKASNAAPASTSDAIAQKSKKSPDYYDYSPDDWPMMSKLLKAVCDDFLLLERHGEWVTALRTFIVRMGRLLA